MSDLHFIHTRNINAYGTILKPLANDFGPIFYQSVLIWCGIIPYETKDTDVFWNIWLIKDNYQPIGICGLYTLSSAKDTSQLWLGWLGIIPELRNKGLGKQVMNHLYEQAESIGCKEIFSYVDKEGGPLNFYKREGFEILGTVKEYLQQTGLNKIDGNDFEDQDDFVIRKTL